MCGSDGIGVPINFFKHLVIWVVHMLFGLEMDGLGIRSEEGRGGELACEAMSLDRSQDMVPRQYRFEPEEATSLLFRCRDGRAEADHHV
jgi:hypothetical protein